MSRTTAARAGRTPREASSTRVRPSSVATPFSSCSSAGVDELELLRGSAAATPPYRPRCEPTAAAMSPHPASPRKAITSCLSCDREPQVGLGQEEVEAEGRDDGGRHRGRATARTPPTRIVSAMNRKVKLEAVVKPRTGTRAMPSRTAASGPPAEVDQAVVVVFHGLLLERIVPLRIRLPPPGLSSGRAKVAAGQGRSRPAGGEAAPPPPRRPPSARQRLLDRLQLLRRITARSASWLRAEAFRRAAARRAACRAA